MHRCEIQWQLLVNRCAIGKLNNLNFHKMLWRKKITPIIESYLLGYDKKKLIYPWMYFRDCIFTVTVLLIIFCTISTILLSCRWKCFIIITEVSFLSLILNVRNIIIFRYLASLKINATQLLICLQFNSQNTFHWFYIASGGINLLIFY